MRFTEVNARPAFIIEDDDGVNLGDLCWDSCAQEYVFEPTFLERINSYNLRLIAQKMDRLNEEARPNG